VCLCVRVRVRVRVCVCVCVRWGGWEGGVGGGYTTHKCTFILDFCNSSSSSSSSVRTNAPATSRCRALAPREHRAKAKGTLDDPFARVGRRTGSEQLVHARPPVLLQGMRGRESHREIRNIAAIAPPPPPYLPPAAEKAHGLQGLGRKTTYRRQISYTSRCAAGTCGGCHVGTQKLRGFVSDDE
jgi:hypothetical protein